MPLRIGLTRSPLRAGIVLVYHRLDSRTGNAARELAPPIDERLARRQLEYVGRSFRVVPLRELRSAIAERGRGQPFPAAITFDDDYVEHVDRAAPLLRQLRLPATFFLTGTKSDDDVLWWEAVNRAVSLGRNPEEIGALIPSSSSGAPGQRAATIASIGQRIEALSATERSEFLARLDASPGEGMSKSSRELAAELVTAGFDIGFHTSRHEQLTRLDDEALEAAMTEGLEELCRAAGQPVDSIAYPHGKADSRVAACARRAGFELGLTTDAVAATPRSCPLLIGRYDVFTAGPELAGLRRAMVRILLNATRLGSRIDRRRAMDSSVESRD